MCILLDKGTAKTVVIEAIQENIQNCLLEWERLFGSKDDVHYALTKVVEELEEYYDQMGEDRAIPANTLQWDEQKPKSTDPSVALKLLFRILHEYFVQSNGQKERDVGHRLWAVMSSEFVQPEPTAADLAWASEVLKQHDKALETLRDEN